MDSTMQEDVAETSVKIRWRSSKFGGKAFAGPSATTEALTASRRRGNQAVSAQHFLTEVSIHGEIGREDGQVVALLMNHAIRATGIALKETDYSRAPKPGEYIHLSSQDSQLPPGRIRVLLESSDEIRRLYNALNGQTIQVGDSRVGIEVANDLIAGQSVPGGSMRSWA